MFDTLMTLLACSRANICYLALTRDDVNVISQAHIFLILELTPKKFGLMMVYTMKAPIQKTSSSLLYLQFYNF